MLPHTGLLWNKLRDDYPILEHAQPIGSLGTGEVLVDKFTGLPLPRVWFINNSDDQLVQFQNDRFYFNWRKKNNDYPRYDHVINRFENVSRAVKELFVDFELGEIEPTAYELSYINHIPKGMGWETNDDLAEIFTQFLWNNQSTRFLPSPKTVEWHAVFYLPEEKGRLLIRLKHAVRTKDELPLLVFELSATGIDGDNNFRSWFNLAHEWIVRGFTDLTTEKMHTIWEME